MAYGKRRQRKYKRSKRYSRRTKRKGFRRRDFTPSIKLEQYFTVGTYLAGSSSLQFSTSTSTFVNSVPYTSCFDDNGTWGKYKNNYGTYKITGVAIEFGFTKDLNTTEVLFTTMPYLAGAHFPSEDSSYAPSSAVIKQIDNTVNISPRSLGMTRHYQRFPSNYISNKLTRVGIGVWNSVTEFASQMGVFGMGIVNNVTAVNNLPGPAFSAQAFAYLKISLYVRFGSKRIQLIIDSKNEVTHNVILDDIIHDINTNPAAISDPVVIDDIASYLAEGDGERIGEDELEEIIPDLYNNVHEVSHDFNSHNEYVDVTNQYKFHEPNTVNVDETYRVIKKGDMTYVVDDEIIKAREFTFSDEIGGLFNSDELDKALLVRGKTILEKYKTPRTDKILGIKRKRYVVDGKAVLLEQDIDKSLKFKKTKGGKLYLQGDRVPEDPVFQIRGFFDDQRRRLTWGLGIGLRQIMR